MSTQEIFDAVLAFDEATVKAKTQAELSAGTEIGSILNDGLISAMDEVGERFSTGELFVPEMLMAAQAMKAGLGILKPHLAEGQSRSKGTVVIGTVKGDLHDIGKSLWWRKGRLKVEGCWLKTERHQLAVTAALVGEGRRAIRPHRYLKGEYHGAYVLSVRLPGSHRSSQPISPGCPALRPAQPHTGAAFRSQ